MTCEGCGVWHTPWWCHMYPDGTPRPVVEDLGESTYREVVFHGFDDDGRVLYRDAK